jgi:hypothetical protein
VTHNGIVSTLVPKDAIWHDFKNMSNCHDIWYAYNVGSIIKTLYMTILKPS